MLTESETLAYFRIATRDASLVLACRPVNQVEQDLTRDSERCDEQ